MRGSRLVSGSSNTLPKEHVRPYVMYTCKCAMRTLWSAKDHHSSGPCTLFVVQGWLRAPNQPSLEQLNDGKRAVSNGTWWFPWNVLRWLASWQERSRHNHWACWKFWKMGNWRPPPPALKRDVEAGYLSLFFWKSDRMKDSEMKESEEEATVRKTQAFPDVHKQQCGSSIHHPAC